VASIRRSTSGSTSVSKSPRDAFDLITSAPTLSLTIAAAARPASSRALLRALRRRRQAARQVGKELLLLCKELLLLRVQGRHGIGEVCSVILPRDALRRLRGIGVIIVGSALGSSFGQCAVLTRRLARRIDQSCVDFFAEQPLRRAVLVHKLWSGEEGDAAGVLEL